MVDFLEEVRLGQDDLEKERGNLVEVGYIFNTRGGGGA